MNAAAAITKACEDVPHVRSGALVLLPEGFCLAGVGAVSHAELEPAIRATTRLLAASTDVEFVLAFPDELVVIERGRRDPRLALMLTCSREPNLVFVQRSARAAMDAIERDVDLAALGLS